MINRNFIRTEALKSLYEYLINVKVLYEDFATIDKNKTSFIDFIELLKTNPDYSNFEIFRYELQKLKNNIINKLKNKEKIILDNLFLLYNILAILLKIFKKENYLFLNKFSNYLTFYEIQIKNKNFYKQLSNKELLDLELAVQEFYYKKIKENPDLENYYKKNEESNIIKYIIEKLIFKSEHLKDFFTKNDFSYMNSKNILLDLLLRNTKLNILCVEFLNKNDLLFYETLVKNVIDKWKFFHRFIKSNTINWDIDRIFSIDKIIILLGINEYLFIKTPKKVIINEYINISKAYSTPKSKVFINGMLEKLCNEISLSSIQL